jgi:hypothetical protein
MITHRAAKVYTPLPATRVPVEGVGVILGTSVPKPWPRCASPVRHAMFTIRNMTGRMPRFSESPTMSVITIKRRVIKRTPYRQSLVLRSFRGLSQSYFASEKSWEFAMEALLFAIIMALSAWPVFAAASALNEFLQSIAS